MKRFPLFLFATAWPWLAAAPNHLFVFEKGALEAKVYDASSLTPPAYLTVGRGAISAFSVTRPDNGEPEKFLVVSENGVSIFNADFSPRGTLFLPTSGFPTAAAISHDRNLLAVAAGEVLFLIDTSSESIRAEIELGFAATGLAIRGDRRRVYLISSHSRHVRVVDIDEAALRGTALVLAEPPGAITTAADGSRVYVTTRGAIYALDERAERFFTPLLSNSRGEAIGNFPLNSTLSDQPLIDRLVVAARGRFFLRSGEKLLRGVLGSAGTTAEAVLPPDEIPGGLADLAASPDGRLLYFLTRAGRLVQWDAAAGVPTAETTLASSPDAISLTTPPIAQEGSLNKFSGHEQMVRSSSSFAIVAQALDEGGDPQPGVVVNLIGAFPGVAASCDSPLVATDSQGLVVVSCNASTVGTLTIESILINDSFNRAPAPPFSVSIVPLVPGREGLQKLAGDGQLVTEGESFSTTFKVTDFLSTVPRENAVISVSSEPSGVVSCDTSSNGFGLVDDVGEAAFTCRALDVAENTVVLISVTDDGGRTIADPFAATVVGEDVPVSGLTKLSGDNQTVLQNSAFPEPLRVSDRFGGELQEDVVLTVNTTPGGVVFCGSGVLTDSSGVGTINCNAGAVGSTTPVQISVTDEFLQELDVPFLATVLSDVPTEEGLNKVSGDNQVAPRNSVLPLPLVVSAVLDGEPQADLALSISTTDQFLLMCPLAEMTGPNGLASISCNTRSVVVPTDVQVLVSDDLGRSLPSPFKVTVVPTSSEDVDSLTLLTDSFLEVLVGETVEDAIEVLALDVDDDPVAGAAIFFSSNRDATFDPLVALTGFNGRTDTSVTFGCFSGLGTIDIALEPDGDAELSVGFQASPGLAGLITKVQGDNQSGSPGQLLNQVALVARVTDICENPIQGVSVTWTVEPPEAATLINTISTTDGQGRSSTLVQLGNRPGPFTITVTSGSLEAVFTLTVEVDATQLAIVSGNNQTLALGETTPLPLVVEARDDNNQGVPGVEVTFAVIQGSATITTDTTVMTNALGRAQVFVQAGTVLGTIRIGASAVGENVSFTINTIGRLPQVTSLGFVNGASFRQGWVPGSAGSIFGVGLMEGVDGIVLPPDFPFPTIFLGVRVRVNGREAPILSMANINGQEQINVQVPFGLTAPGTATVRIENNGAEATVTGVPLFPVQPGIFENPRNGVKIAAALHADFSVVDASRPARRGEIILLFLTGLGRLDREVGTNVPGPVPPARSVVSPVVGIDDEGVEVLGSFYAPDLITAFQINFRVPQDAQFGNRKLSVVADGVPSQDTLLPIGP